MTTFERHHVSEVLDLLDRGESAPIVAVVGPRQTGKTTIVRHALRRGRIPGWHIAVDDPDADEPTPWPAGRRKRDAEWLVSVWRAAREKARTSEHGFLLALDEVQHIKDWSRTVKGLWDRDREEGRRLRVVVLGSAPWDMLTGIGESLVGRFMPVPVRQWSLREMAAFDYSLEDYLCFGGYPRAARWRRSWGEWHDYIVKSIVKPTIGKDILSLTRIDKPALLRRLMELIPRYSGQILSYNKMLGQLQDAGNTTTLARYLELLGNAGLATGLSGYPPRAGRGSIPKLNVLDPAIMTAALGYTPDEAKADRTLWGRIVESAVGAHLHNTLPPAATLHYWRQGDLEVDFVLARGPRVLGIEVKSGRTHGTLKGLRAFKERFPKARTLVVGGGGVPLDEFLWESASYWLEE